VDICAAKARFESALLVGLLVVWAAELHIVTAITLAKNASPTKRRIRFTLRIAADKLCRHNSNSWEHLRVIHKLICEIFATQFE
jgi:hypothetical protein